MNNKNNNQDLFRDLDSIPNKMLRMEIRVTLNMLEAGEGDSYQLCRTLLRNVQAHGYTFDYGLECKPYGLQKQMIDGGDR